MYVREIQSETRVPSLPAFRMFAGKIRRIFSRGAETGGTNHGAITAGKASCGLLLPDGAFEVAREHFLQAGGIEESAHLPARL